MGVPALDVSLPKVKTKKEMSHLSFSGKCSKEGIAVPSIPYID